MGILMQPFTNRAEFLQVAPFATHTIELGHHGNNRENLAAQNTNSNAFGLRVYGSGLGGLGLRGRGLEAFGCIGFKVRA